MPQYGFFIDTSRCIGCNACVLACKQWHDIEPGPAKPIRVHQWEKGAFPDIDVNVLPLMCMHCAHPRCADACDHGAIYKEDKYGDVLVDQSKCVGDRNCYAACPYGAPQFKSDAPGEKMLKCTMCIDRLEKGLSPICVLSCSMRALDFGPLDELKKKYGDQGCYILEEQPPCHNACPAGVNAQKNVNHIAEGNLDAALSEYYRVTPLAGVLGRVCTHVCEVDCFRGRFDDAVSVRELKRYMADKAGVHGERLLPKPAAPNGKRVAVIGAGPSGLSCAYQLTLKGYQVDVFDKREQAGGMMRYGIPPYRLPRSVLEHDIALYQAMGISIHTDSLVQNAEALLGEYAAVYVATGCTEGVRLAVPGNDLPEVRSAVDFLFALNAGKAPALGKRIAVIGGGNVAMDAARSARRLGAEQVDVISLEKLDMHSKDRMPAQEEEIHEACEEGITFHPGHGIVGFQRVDGGVRLLCNECVSVRDDDGRFNPRYRELTPPVCFEADDVLVAIGQRSDEAAYPTGLPKGNRGPDMDAHFASKAKGIFAGGDLVSGPSDCISAIAAGNEAAESIDRYCKGEKIDVGRKVIPKTNRLRVEKKSLPAPVALPGRRVKSFEETTQTFDERTACEQANRCLRCGSLLPSALFWREQPKRVIVPWDKMEALQLWSKRHPENGEPLPDIIDSVAAALKAPPADRFCRNKLVLKPLDSADKLLHTTDDE